MGKGKKNKNKNKNNIDNKKKEAVTKFENESFLTNRMEELLVEKIELLYKIAQEKLVMESGLQMSEATRAILLNGSVFGEEKNIVSNILKNSLEVSSDQYANDNIQPVFQDVPELARYSMQKLINMIVHHQSKPTKKEAAFFLIQSEFLSFHHDDDDDENDKEKPITGASGINIDIDLGKMLKQQKNTTLGHISTNSNNSQNYKPTLTRDPYLTTSCPDGMRFEDWLFNVCGKDEKAAIARRLAEKVEKLEIQLKERKEWAMKTVINAAKKVSDSGLLLQELRFKGNIVKMKEKMEGNDESSSTCNKLRLSEREEYLKHLKQKLEVRNELKREMEEENRMYKSEIVAYDLSFSETEKSIADSKKRQKKLLKKCIHGEKVNDDLKRKFEEEKAKIEEMGKRQQELNQKFEQLKVKIRQTKEEKEQACVLLMERKRLYKLEKINSKNRLAYVRRELDIKFQQSTDEEKRLELELSQIKGQIMYSSPSFAAVESNHEDHQYQFKYQTSKPCMICKKGDVNVVFLPCAHQVICSNCNEEVYDALEGRCPCCKTLIENRINVYGPSSD